MKKQFLFALSLGLCVGSLWAQQPRSASEPQKLLQTSVGLMAPVWSPTGDKIAVTTDNYTGILVINADGSGLQSVTSAPGAGYKMTWSADGNRILGRTNIVDNYRTYHEVKVWSVVDGSSVTLVGKTRELKGMPTWKSVERISIAGSRGYQNVNTLNATISAPRSTNVYDIMVNDPVGAVAQIPALSNFAGKIIINPALSPNGEKVAFQVPGYGIYVCNIDGNNLESVAMGVHPSWLPDSENLIFTRVSDDGQVYTASDLYSINLSTKKEYLLTGNTSMIPMRPSVSPNGQQVVFENAADASIYVINLKY